MTAKTIIDTRPLWWMCFLDRVKQLRKQRHHDDIRYHHSTLSGYISGLFCTETINDHGYQLLDQVADNAREWALKDCGEEA